MGNTGNDRLAYLAAYCGDRRETVVATKRDRRRGYVSPARSNQPAVGRTRALAQTESGNDVAAARTPGRHWPVANTCFRNRTGKGVSQVSNASADDAQPVDGRD